MFLRVFPKRPSSILSFSITAILASVSFATNSGVKSLYDNVVAPIEATCIETLLLTSAAVSLSLDKPTSAPIFFPWI